MDETVSHTGGTLLPARAWAALTRPVDALPLDLFRVCVGLVLLAYFVRTFLEVADFSGPDGLLDHELILEMYWFTEIGIFRPGMAVEWFYGAFAIACACCIPLILGYRVKLFAAILYVIAVSTYRRNFIVMYVDDSIMHLLLFWMLILPVGRTLVLGEWCAQRGKAWQRWKQVQVPGATLRLFFVNLTLLYLVAGLWKWTSPMWLDGTALYVVFKLPISYFHDFWGAQHIPLLKVFNYATLVLEPLVPLMFVLPRGSRVKYVMLAAFLGLHLLSVLTLNIPYANIACAATAVLIFREEIMGFLRSELLNGRDYRPTMKIGFSGAVAMFMVLMLTLAMISSVSLINWRTAPRELEAGVEPAAAAPRTPQLVDGRADGLQPAQMTFFGALWIMGIAQQYQLFNWIDHRNYTTHYRLVENGVEADPDAMFVRSLRGVLLDFYIHDVTWVRVPPDLRRKLRTSILTRTASRYCRNERPSGEIAVHSSLERIDPNGGAVHFDEVLLMKFECRDGGTPAFTVGP